MSLVSSVLGDLAEGFSLPITRRGLFAKDDFFQGFQKDYSSAVDDVLNRWSSKASKADRFASYRRLRERDASEDSKAATISDNENTYVIVLDMSEFTSGQITVQTLQCSAVVEGSCSGKTYKKQFPLPNNTEIDRVTADLSDEGILTVTAPKKGRVVSIGKGEGTDAAQQPSTASTASIESQIVPTDTQGSQSLPSLGERMIHMTLEGNGAVASSAAQSIRNEALSTERRSSQSRIIPLNIEGEDPPTTVSSQTSSQSVKEVSEKIIPTSVQEQESYRTSVGAYQNRVLPIRRRGRFFQDPSFENVWKDFETAIDELVERRGSNAGMEKGKGGDRHESYRNLRDVVQQDDNQAASQSKESNEYKIVVDVKDFVDGHLDVKSHAGCIIVTGRKGPYSFERRFTVSGLTQPDKVTASLSEDGVLTITAPM